MREEQSQQLIQFATTLHEQQGSEDSILQATLKHMGRAVEAEGGCIIAFAEDASVQQVYALGAQSTSHSTRRAVWANLLHYGVIGLVYYGQQIVALRNIKTDPRWSDVSQISFLARQGSAIAVPIQSKKQVLAVLLLTHPQIDYFNPEHGQYLKAAANVAAPALRTARSLAQANRGMLTYQMLFEHTLVPMLLTDRTGIIRIANHEAARYVGFNTRDLQGVTLQDLNIDINSQGDLNELEPDEERFLTTSVYDIEGREIPTMIRIRQLDYNGEQLLEWMLQDISAQMELEQLRRDLTAMVYHDLRGPLSNVQASMLTLNRLLNDDANAVVQRMLELGQRSVRQVKHMVDGLLDIQRLEAGSSILNRQPTDLPDLLREVFELTQPMAAEVMQTIVIKAAPNLPRLSVDRDMVMRVLLNLVENAIKYTPERSLIEIYAGVQDGNVVVRVRDNGPGIAPEMRQQVFDKFSRIRYQDVPKGIGLGLAFCRLATEAHGGRIWVESDGRTGSDFIVSLPLVYNQDISEEETLDADLGAGEDSSAFNGTPHPHREVLSTSQ